MYEKKKAVAMCRNLSSSFFFIINIIYNERELVIQSRLKNREKERRVI